MTIIGSVSRSGQIAVTVGGATASVSVAFAKDDGNPATHLTVT